MTDQLRDATEMIDDRLRIERLVRANARRAMVIDIIERLVEDPEREDFGPSDMEYWSPLHDALREKLRAALAEQEVEPCHVFSVTVSGHVHEWEPAMAAFALQDGKHALYTTPPRREWRGLTDEEIEAAWKSCDPKRLLPSFAAAIEAALKEKNHD